MNERRKFRIEGRVQGVWFRESTRQQAAMAHPAQVQPLAATRQIIASGSPTTRMRPEATLAKPRWVP